MKTQQIVQLTEATRATYSSRSRWSPSLSRASSTMARHTSQDFRKVKYSSYLNTGHPNTGFIWIPDTLGVWHSNGKVMWLGWLFEYQTFWTIRGFLSPYFSPPFKYQTIWQPDTNLPFEYQTSPVNRWLLYTKSVMASLFVYRPEQVSQKAWRVKKIRPKCTWAL